MTGEISDGVDEEVTIVRPDQVDDHLRAVEAARMRRDGAQWADIADQVGYASPGSAHRAVTRLVRRESVESAAEYREIALARYEWLYGEAVRRIQSADSRALVGSAQMISTALKAQDRIVALLGLAADAGQLAPTVQGREQIDRDVAVIRARLQQLTAGEDTTVETIDVEAEEACNDTDHP
ncbi:hypothetical protein [Tsukamurella paurometabola]|uniref:Helix-turn-helix DNA binding domain protein n=1 Tax=Tsukamurella paurometabola TaxID=2061 RepID=A0A3P8MB02_TSUPA|nr:hypothetical protein [Tsukamurella paurometabola]UEA81796.1 hypothetical protein LK411_15560 [Tsukamurella paurometabola]VDR38810.1 Uncharacterised protein [Tsukamurella paurometabola]